MLLFAFYTFRASRDSVRETTVRIPESVEASPLNGRPG